MKTFRKSFIKRKPLRKASAKAQSAMEYLMTYGWAILIIAVVLAALFQLGVFNPMTFAPKAPPGSCQVFRPNGPYTTSFINLEGICSGELPQYVASFNGNGYVTLPKFSGSTEMTIVMWVYDLTPLGYGSGSLFTWGSPYNSNSSGIIIFESGSYYGVITYNNQFYNYAILKSPNKWVQVALTVSNSNKFWETYKNGMPTYYKNITGFEPANLTDALIGNSFNGLIANVQIYNTSLSANEIQALYQEGIGGAPIDLQHLVAWWPLNGNANDYSGNGNNGQINNVNFVSNWYNGYTPP